MVWQTRPPDRTEKKRGMTAQLVLSVTNHLVSGKGPGRASGRPLAAAVVPPANWAYCPDWDDRTRYTCVARLRLQQLWTLAAPGAQMSRGGR